MKTLTKHLNEKLIINKNYKNIYNLEALFDNVDFEHYDRHMFVTSDDIFSIMVDYIRDHNIKSFSDFDSYSNRAKENNNACLAVFNKRIKEIDIFQKIVTDSYKVLVIFKLSYVDRYVFKGGERSFISMHVLRNSDTWNNTNDVEYYEISEETFNDISELYNELIKK